MTETKTGGPISDAALRYGWTFILCKKGSKDPFTPHGRHERRDLAGAQRHLKSGGNIGLTGSNLAVLDWDDAEAREILFKELGPLPLTVRTARGKAHTYISGDTLLPGTMRLPDGKLVGEIRRLPSEYVVCPPSQLLGGTYTCLLDRIDLRPLPPVWWGYFNRQMAAVAHPTERGEPFVVPERIDAGGDGRPGLSRHRVFFLWTRSWKAQGIALEMTLETLSLANKNITFPPLDDHELRRYVTRCYNQADREEFTRPLLTEEDRASAPMIRAAHSSAPVRYADHSSAPMLRDYYENAPMIRDEEDKR